MLVCALPPSETHAVLQSQSSFSLNTSAFLGTSSIKLAGFTVSTATLQWFHSGQTTASLSSVSPAISLFLVYKDKDALGEACLKCLRCPAPDDL